MVRRSLEAFVVAAAVFCLVEMLVVYPSLGAAWSSLGAESRRRWPFM